MSDPLPCLCSWLEIHSDQVILVLFAFIIIIKIVCVHVYIIYK